MKQTKDEGYIIAASYCTLMKTDEWGDTIWTRYYNSAGYFVSLTNDDGYIVTGNRVFKTDENGDTLWTKPYEYYNVHQTIDGEYVLSQSDFPNAYLLLKLNSEGDSLWLRRFDIYEGDFGDDRNYLSLTKDRGYVLLANSSAYGPRDYMNLWVAKTDSLGRIPIQVSPTKVFEPTEGGDHYQTIPRAQFTNFGTEESAKDFYCHFRVLDLYDSTYLYHDSILVTSPLSPWESREIEFSMWTAPTVSSYIATFYTTQAGDCQPWPVNYRWTGIEEQPITHQSDWQVVTAVGPNIVLRFTDASGPQGGCVAIFDAAGRLVDELHVPQTGGTITWGEGYTPGVYFIRIEGDAPATTHKVILIR